MELAIVDKNALRLDNRMCVGRAVGRPAPGHGLHVVDFLEKSVILRVSNRRFWSFIGPISETLGEVTNPRTIPLFCWILDVSDRSFSVSIEETQTVDNLKKVIVKEKSTTFANIEADQLTLWKVSSTFSFGQTMLITLS